MKKIIVFLLLLTAGFVNAQDIEKTAETGNQLYQKKQYEKAIEAYHKVLESGYESEDLYYNLGNAYFKTGRLGYAILYYEKALKLSPNDEDIQYNLRIANARTVDKLETLPKLFFVKWWEGLINLFSVNGWTIMAYFIYLLLLASVAMYFFASRGNMQKWAFISSGGFLALLIFAVIMLSVRVDQDIKLKSAVVTETAVTVKLAPDFQSGDAFIVHEGIKVTLDDEVNNWVKIRLSDGKVGWLSKNDLKTI